MPYKYLIRLSAKQMSVIFDVLNVYDPNDVKDVYPEMAEEEFTREVQETWLQFLNVMQGKEITVPGGFNAEDYTSDGNGFILYDKKTVDTNA